MSSNSGIEWTESTWNPLTGCTKISPGCQNCYAARMANRLCAMGHPHYKNNFKLTIHRESLLLPLSWKKPQLIFVNSMSDLFHEEVPLNFILDIFEVMNRATWHKFQILTKRAENLLKWDAYLNWSENIWMGVTVETSNYVTRIQALKKTSAINKFISFEPLLDTVGRVDLDGIDWVIVGGESGPGARIMEKSWVDQIKKASKKYRVPFFFKQWGGVRKKEAGRVLDGVIWNEYPNNLKPLVA